MVKQFLVPVVTSFLSLKDFQDTDGPQPTDWERYAQEEYDLLVAEEGANEPTEGYVKVVRVHVFYSEPIVISPCPHVFPGEAPTSCTYIC